MKNENDQNDNVNKNVGTSEPKSGASTSAKMARDTNEGFTGNGVTSLQSPDGGNEDLGAKAKDAADSIVTQAKATAGDAYHAVADKASAAIDTKKSEFSVGLIGVADTVRRISDTISGGETQNGVTEYASQYVGTAAKKIEGVAEYFDGADLKKMAGDAESFARRNPAIFLGAAFAVGVLAARFLRSSPPSDAAAKGAQFRGSGAAGRNNQEFAATA